MNSFIKVESSNIEGLSYNPEFKEMHILFKNGGHYIFEQVDNEVFNEMLSAESAGKYFYKHIKGRYESRKGEGIALLNTQNYSVVFENYKVVRQLELSIIITEDHIAVTEAKVPCPGCNTVYSGVKTSRGMPETCKTCEGTGSVVMRV